MRDFRLSRSADHPETDVKWLSGVSPNYSWMSMRVRPQPPQSPAVASVFKRRRLDEGRDVARNATSRNPGEESLTMASLKFKRGVVLRHVPGFDYPGTTRVKGR
jgi:hypothetical protein